MAQRPTADFNIDPNITSGTDLANILNRFQDAIDSGNSGASRPAYLAAGGLWVREGDPMRLYLYDGTTDRELYNTTDGIVGALEDGTVDGQITTWNASSGEWTPEGALVVDANGQVGIGTNPTSTFHVFTDQATNAPVVIENDGSNALGAQISFKNPHNSQLYVGLSGDDKGDFIVYNAHSTGSLQFSTNGTERVRIDSDGRVGIGGTPSRSTKEIEEEAEATLRNWDSKDKKPTKAELIKQLTERNIGGGAAKLQVAGDIFTNQNLVVNGGYVLAQGLSGLKFESNAWRPVNSVNGASDGQVDLGLAGTRFKDGYFSGAVNAGTLVTNNHVLKDSTSGLTFQTNAIVPLNSSNSNTNGQVDLGSAGVKFKDAHFSGTVYVNGSPLTRVGDIIETFRTLKNAVSDETTVEGIKEALTNSLGGLIEKFEAMQSAATQEIES